MTKHFLLKHFDFNKNIILRQGSIVLYVESDEMFSWTKRTAHETHVARQWALAIARVRACPLLRTHTRTKLLPQPPGPMAFASATAFCLVIASQMVFPPCPLASRLHRHFFRGQNRAF